MKKPNIKDFLCQACGMVHKEEYETTVKIYNDQKVKPFIVTEKICPTCGKPLYKGKCVNQ